VKNLLIHTRQGEFNLLGVKTETECWIDHFSEPKNRNSKKIFIQLDPNEYLNLNNLIIQKQNEYDFIFTFEPDLLKNCNNSILFEYGTSWVNPSNYNFPKKIFSISFVCNSKYHNPGHILRHEINDKQDLITIPKIFFISSMNPDKNDKFYIQKDPTNNYNNPTLGVDKYPLFESMFSICIENVKKNFYFSEKLIDCFLCKSIPIYYGCNNIKNYFNTDGMILINDFDDFLLKVNKLDESFYNSKKEVIDENYFKALKWVDYGKRIISKINEVL
jgi:hypothetical protein